MAQKNQVIYSSDNSKLERLNEEFHDYLGRDTRLDKSAGRLTIFALPRKYKKKSQREQKARSREEDYNPAWDKYSER